MPAIVILLVFICALVVFNGTFIISLDLLMIKILKPYFITEFALMVFLRVFLVLSKTANKSAKCGWKNNA